MFIPYNNEQRRVEHCRTVNRGQWVVGSNETSMKHTSATIVKYLKQWT